MKSPTIAAATLSANLVGAGGVSVVLLSALPTERNADPLTVGGLQPVRVPTWNIDQRTTDAIATNAAPVSFARITGDRSVVARAWALVGPDGAWRYAKALPEPLELRPRDQLILEPGDLTVVEG